MGHCPNYFSTLSILLDGEANGNARDATFALQLR